MGKVISGYVSEQAKWLAEMREEHPEWAADQAVGHSQWWDKSPEEVALMRQQTEKRIPQHAYPYDVNFTKTC